MRNSAVGGGYSLQTLRDSAKELDKDRVLVEFKVGDVLDTLPSGTTYVHTHKQRDIAYVNYKNPETGNLSTQIPAEIVRNK